MKIIFIVILMVGLAYGQDSTVMQAVERFAVEMDSALNQIEDFQTQINTLRVRILALEYELSNADTSKWAIAQIDSAITSLANSDTSKYTITEIDSLLEKIR